MWRSSMKPSEYVVELVGVEDSAKQESAKQLQVVWPNPSQK